MKTTSALSAAAIPITLALFSVACNGNGIWGTWESSETGGEESSKDGIPDGVYVDCLNLDSSNYWWTFGPGGVPIKNVGHGTQALNICIGPTNMGLDFNLVDDWDEGYNGYPGFDAQIRSLCTRRCDSTHKRATRQMEVCEDANWTGHAVPGWGYDPAVNGATCEVNLVHPHIIDDPNASDIDWNEGAGASPLNLPLKCSLLDDCADAFDAQIDEWALAHAAGGALDLIAPHTRSAAFHAVTGSTGSSIALDMVGGSGDGYDDENALVGQAEYSPSFCGDSTCPFYLAAFEAGNDVDEWRIYLSARPVVAERKEISNVQIDLLKSALAAWRPSTGRVAFPPGSLVFQVDFEISSDRCAGNCTGIGDGAHSNVLVNPEVVFGTFNELDGSLTLDYRFPVVGGEATLNVALVAVGGPPDANINLPAQAQCNHPDGYELTPSEDGSTDGDGDLNYTVWYVDGVVRPSGYVIPLGRHTVDLLAVDMRGAHGRAGAQRLEVVQGPACQKQKAAFPQ